MRVSSETLPGLFMEPWAEVSDDMFGIADQIKQKDSTCRLVVNREDGVFALAKYIDNQSWMDEPGWVVAMRFRDLTEDDHLYRVTPPDARLVRQMEAGDMRKRDPQREAQKFRVMAKMQKLKELQKIRDTYSGPVAEETLHTWRKKTSRKAPRIYVP